MSSQILHRSRVLGYISGKPPIDLLFIFFYYDYYYYKITIIRPTCSDDLTQWEVNVIIEEMSCIIFMTYTYTYLDLCADTDNW